MRRLSVALFAAALVAGACGGASVSPTPAPTARPPFELAGTPMDACTLKDAWGVCGTLRVPEDRSDPEGRSIDLRVAVIPAISTTPEPDPVFFLDGGPGGAATEDLGWTANYFTAVHLDRDIVLVDQRGTGGSNRLVSPQAPDTTGMTTAQAKDTVARWVADLLAKLPGDPRFYTTSVAMDDIDAVRAALGYDKINLYGASYGATAAQYYMRQYPQHVRSVVLDGATLLDVPIFERIAANSQAALDIVLARCNADQACHTAFPDVAAEFKSMMAKLAKSPVTTTVPHPWTGKPMVIDALTMAGAIHTALITADTSALIPLVIHEAYLGHWDAVAAAIASAMGPQSADTTQLVMSSVIRCSEAWARFDPAEVQRIGATSYDLDAQLAEARNQAMSCPYVPTGVVPADDAAPVRSDLPALLILGQADPQDPQANVAKAPLDMPSSLTVVVPGEGHTVGHLGCMPQMVSAFIVAGTTKGLDTTCAATGVQLPPFRTAP